MLISITGEKISFNLDPKFRVFLHLQIPTGKWVNMVGLKWTPPPCAQTGVKSGLVLVKVYEVIRDLHISNFDSYPCPFEALFIIWKHVLLQKQKHLLLQKQKKKKKKKYVCSFSEESAIYGMPLKSQSICQRSVTSYSFITSSSWSTFPVLNHERADYNYDLITAMAN